MSCTCQECGSKYVVDLIVPDSIWGRIKPDGKPEGGGLLCGRCIMDKIKSIGKYDSFHLVKPQLEFDSKKKE